MAMALPCTFAFLTARDKISVVVHTWFWHYSKQWRGVVTNHCSPSATQFGLSTQTISLEFLRESCRLSNGRERSQTSGFYKWDEKGGLQPRWR
jgi:hypothetical protein